MKYRSILHAISALALGWATGCVSANRPTDVLEQNRKLKNELADKQQAVQTAREENRKRRREQRNLEKCVEQMESVLANIDDPSVPVIVPPLERVHVLDTIIEEPLDRPLASPRTIPADKGQLVDMQDGRKALKVTVDPNETKKDRRVPISLPMDRLVGAKLRCTVMAKGVDISKPPVHWGGGKFQLWVRTPAKSHWPAASIGGGTFDWKEITFTYDVPYDATGVNMYLGLEQVSGTIYFRDLKVELIEQ